MQQNGLDGTTSSIASGRSSRAKSSNTTSLTPNNMETSRTSMQLSIMDELMFSVEGSHANRSASQDNEREQRTNATCGQRCLELSESVNPVGSWARTFAGLLIGRTDWFSKRVTLTWKILGTPSNRLLFQLAPQARHTDATEFGLLLTPTTREEVMDMDKFKTRMEKYDNGTTVPNLATQIHAMLPTPTAYDWNTPRKPETFKKAQERHKAKGVNLQNPLKQMASDGMLPTPTAFQAQANPSIDRGKGNLSDKIAKQFKIGGKTSRLSPLFVEQMMGFPKNWTALPFQSGEENPSKPTETP